jgi:regulator of extracellular matrix RemA (YlzA/DUF370 family)
MKNIFVNIGFGNIISVGRVVAVVSPGSAPIKKLREEARAKGKLIDATEGKKMRSIIVTDSDHIILSAIQVETIAQRISGSRVCKFNGESEESEYETKKR